MLVYQRCLSDAHGCYVFVRGGRTMLLRPCFSIPAYRSSIRYRVRGAHLCVLCASDAREFVAPPENKTVPAGLRMYETVALPLLRDGTAMELHACARMRAQALPAVRQAFEERLTQ